MNLSKKKQNEQIKQKQSYDKLTKDYINKQKRIYDYGDKKSTMYPTNSYYLDEKINDPNRSLALLSGGDIIVEKYNQIENSFTVIYDDISKIIGLFIKNNIIILMAK